ncbi:MAG: SDR family oxidoreductase [Longimicrobiales bacterium]
MAELAEKVAIVTGGTKGIGKAIAASLVQAGASVVVNARDEAQVAAAVDALDPEGKGQVHGVAADIGDPDACVVVVDQAISRFGRLDVLINNAGVGVFKSITEMSVAEWRRQVDTNLGGVFYLSKAAIPHLTDTGDGFIINIGSLASRHAFPGGTGYNASKFGLLGMTEAMMGDLRAQNIRVSIVMPGSVDTHFSGREPVYERTWRLSPEDVALAVMQLVSYPKEAHMSRVEIRPSLPNPG